MLLIKHVLQWIDQLSGQIENLSNLPSRAAQKDRLLVERCNLDPREEIVPTPNPMTTSPQRNRASDDRQLAIMG